VTRGRPQLQLGVSARANLEERVLPAVVQLDARETLGVAAIEAFRQPEDRGERPHRLAALSRKVHVLFVAVFGRRAAVVPCDERNRVDLLGLEPAQIAVFDQVVRVLVMALVADVHADVVEQRRIL